MNATEWKGPFTGHLAVSKLQNMSAEGPFIYLWRRVMPREDNFVSRRDKAIESLKNQHEKSFVSIDQLAVKSSQTRNDVCVRSEFIRISEISLGSGSLTHEKEESLTAACADIESRARLQNLLVECSHRFGPVLYVGQTDDLRSRVSAHCSARSPFCKRLNALGLDLDHVALFYFSLPNASSKQVDLIESLLTNLFVAPLTLRPG